MSSTQFLPTIINGEPVAADQQYVRYPLSEKWILTETQQPDGKTYKANTNGVIIL
jgi:hypothetical protein